MTEATQSVLVVEDDPTLLEFTAELLADDGLDVIRARDCDEAMAIMESGRVPSILVTDINLAGCRSGLDLASLVAERWPEVRLLIVSGECRPAHGDYPEQAVFFTKPYAHGALVSMIRSPDWSAQTEPAGRLESR
jgi:DNA-binding NtrC family response regulator